MHKTVITDTSPVFYLHRLGYLELLEKLYGGIIIPYSVSEELDEGRKAGEDVPDIEKYKWITLKKIPVPSHIKIIPDLGKGEAEAIALALEERLHLLIIDDSLAREIAKLLSLNFTGTAGVLLRAKKEGLINEIKPVLDKLKAAGFFLKDKLVDDILKLSGEI